jgi:hypothetical protein
LHLPQQVAVDGLAMPNGITGALDGNRIFVMETLKHQLLAYTRSANGILTESGRVDVGR